ncbi:MAG: hypothetical protein Q4C34_07835 [Bacteroidales bacterium]|nr:hypothetical protein [Bacteroidales bacterium]
MELSKFNLPVEIIDLISTLDPASQGIIYSQLFAYIYHGVEPSEDIDPCCRLILKLMIEKLSSRLERARKAQARRETKKDDEIVDASAPVRSPVADRIVQNGRSDHDRISPFGQLLYEAQLRADAGMPRAASDKRRRRRHRIPSGG